MKPAFEIARVISAFMPSMVQAGHLPIEYVKALNALERCRTAALGGHVGVCPSCGQMRISYNSCRNRHCPKCQGFEREKWVAARKEELLPVKYFHVVFTLPDALNALCLFNQRIAYSVLFRAAWGTIQKFAAAQGVQTAMIALLHTWESNLQYHPHLHCIVPAGGVRADGTWRLNLFLRCYAFF
jgi:hypothetical protein